MEEGLKIIISGDSGEAVKAFDEAKKSGRDFSDAMKDVGGSATSGMGDFAEAAKKGGAAAYFARDAVLDFGHIARDIPYAANNFAVLAGPIGRVGSLIGTLTQETGSLKGAFSAILGQLTGISGVVIGVELLVSLFTEFGGALFGAGDSAEKMREQIDELTRSLDYLQEETERVNHDIDSSNQVEVAKLKAVTDDKQAIYNKEIEGLKKRNDNILALQSELRGKTNDIFVQHPDFNLDTFNTNQQAGAEQTGIYKQYEIIYNKLEKLGKEFYDNEKQIQIKQANIEEDARKEQEKANAKAEAEAKRHAAELLRLEQEELAAHRLFLKEMGIARSPLDEGNESIINQLPDAPKKGNGIDPRLDAVLRQNLANLNPIPPDITKDAKTNIDAIIKQLDLMIGKETLTRELAVGIGDAFAEMGKAIINGGNALKSFFDSLKSFVAQILGELLKTAAIAAVLSLLSGGSTSFGTELTGLLKGGNLPHMAEGGIVTGPTVAMIGEGAGPEAVIPLSRLKDVIGTGGGAQVHLHGDWSLSGDKLSLLLNRIDRRNGRLS